MSTDQQWPLSQTINKQKGICSVCKVVRQLNVRGETVHLHGPLKSPCLGSLKAPTAVVTTAVHLSQPTRTTVIAAQISPPSYSQAVQLPSVSEPKEIASEFLPVNLTINKFNSKRPQSATVNTALETSEVWCRSKAFTHPWLTAPIIKHIPKSVRPLCRNYLTDLLRKLCAAPNDLSLWSLLLNFGCNILSKPSRSEKRHTLVLIIRKRLSNVDLVGNTSVNHRSAKPNKGYRTPSLANLVANKMEDGDTIAAIRLICSEERPVYDSEELGVRQAD